MSDSNASGLAARIASDWGAAAKTCRDWRRAGASVAFTNGCFDLLHAGHVSYLAQASALADHLVVGLNTDASVRRLKGPSRPVQTELDRALILAALRSVDLVVLFAEDTPAELIELLEPDVLVKGGDYTVETIAGAAQTLARGGSVRTIPLLEGRSTTGILRKQSER